jgi:hypothetical protein
LSRRHAEVVGQQVNDLLGGFERAGLNLADGLGRVADAAGEVTLGQVEPGALILEPMAEWWCEVHVLPIPSLNLSQ